MVRMTQYTATFKGTSTLSDIRASGDPFENAKLTDKLMGGYLTVGIAL
jgi:hypothetical protein